MRHASFQVDVHRRQLHTQADVVAEGFVHLNQAIFKHSQGLSSLEPNIVEPYLQDMKVPKRNSCLSLNQIHNS